MLRQRPQPAQLPLRTMSSMSSMVLAPGRCGCIGPSVARAGANRCDPIKAAALKPATAPDVVRAGFQLTKLRLPANLAFEVSGPRELTVALDADARNVAIERLAGAWRVEEREGGGCRVSLAARVEACRVVPARVVDYVAERALRRATKWL